MMITNFTCISKLILSHGRIAHKTQSDLILFIFYASLFEAFSQFYFAIISGYSGELVFPDIFHIMFSMFFSLWLIFPIFYYEQDVPHSYVKKFPQIYGAGIFNYHLNWKQILSNYLLSFWHVTAAFYFTINVRFKSNLFFYLFK